jgi:hypothetical protein
MNCLTSELPLLTIVAVAAALTGCGPDIPAEWKTFVPAEGLTSAFGAEDSGKMKKVVLNYDKEKAGGDALRGKFTAKLEPEGFKQVSECVSPSGTSSAMYLGKDKEVFQVIINLLGDQFYDVELQRATGLPGVKLPNADDCKWTDGAKAVCELDAQDRCKFK